MKLSIASASLISAFAIIVGSKFVLDGQVNIWSWSSVSKLHLRHRSFSNGEFANRASRLIDGRFKNKLLIRNACSAKLWASKKFVLS